MFSTAQFGASSLTSSEAITKSYSRCQMKMKEDISNDLTRVCT